MRALPRAPLVGSRDRKLQGHREVLLVVCIEMLQSTPRPFMSCDLNWFPKIHNKRGKDSQNSNSKVIPDPKDDTPHLRFCKIAFRPCEVQAFEQSVKTLKLCIMNGGAG